MNEKSLFDLRMSNSKVSCTVFTYSVAARMLISLLSVDGIFTIYLCIFFFLICLRNISLREQEIVLTDFLNWCMGI